MSTPIRQEETNCSKDSSKQVEEGSFTIDPNDTYSNLRYSILPPVFLVFFTLITQILVVIGNPDLSFGFGFLFSFITGLFSIFAWKGKSDEFFSEDDMIYNK